jgi:hypothetical protein
MKRDIRQQTFSKPGKPDADEIKRLTSDETDNSSPVESKSAEKRVLEKSENTGQSENVAPEKNGVADDAKSGEGAEAANGEKVNPFLLLRGQSSEIGIEKTGYRLRSDYMDLLKLVKRMKKGYTLEAVLDDALTFYFETSEDGRRAVKQRRMLDFD